LYCGRDFSPVANGESIVLGFSFIQDLNIEAGEVITSISGSQFKIEVDEGLDPAPNTKLIGSAAITTPLGSTTNIAVIQRISGLLPDVKYILRAVVTTNLSNTFELYSHVLGENAE
jgi:hypothetical protein